MLFHSFLACRVSFEEPEASFMLPFMIKVLLVLCHLKESMFVIGSCHFLTRCIEIVLFRFILSFFNLNDSRIYVSSLRIHANLLCIVLWTTLWSIGDQYTNVHSQFEKILSYYFFYQPLFSFLFPLLEFLWCKGCFFCYYVLKNFNFSSFLKISFLLSFLYW